ncbi:MAG: hypothetical protein WDZ51_19080 [Pirellulaceae bacterium]
MIFNDYHRTVVGYHGTKLSTARKIINREKSFNPSENSDDWLGHGVYFWEYAPQQAHWWAKRQSAKSNWDEPIAILGSMIRLGFCFDLMDPYNVDEIKQYRETAEATGQRVEDNAFHRKYLDCAVFQYAFAAIEAEQDHKVDSARAVYVPAKPDRVWARSWISKNAHIQICVRNQACILGTWLHYPTQLSGDADDDSSKSKTTEIPIE